MYLRTCLINYIFRRKISIVYALCMIIIRMQVYNGETEVDLYSFILEKYKTFNFKLINYCSQNIMMKYNAQKV